MSFEDILNENNSDVIKEVTKELKAIEGNIKEQFTILKTNYADLKALVDEKVDKGVSDPLLEERLNKFTEDVAARQVVIDATNASIKKQNERMDKLEIMLKRPNMGDNYDTTDPTFKEARDFQIACTAINSTSEKGMSFETLEKLNIDVDSFKKYKKVYEKWLRKYGGSREMLMEPEDYKALQVGVDPDGGVVVTPFMSNRITQRVFETDPMRQLASNESISTGALEWMVEWDEAGYAWEGETTSETTITGETPTPGWKTRRITVHTLAARPRATQTLLEDAGINIENWLAGKISEKFSRAEAAAFITGTGAGMPRGILTYDAGTSYGQVEQVNMGAAAALTADGFVDIKYALKEFFLERGTWLMNRTTVQAAMKLKDGNGDYIWKPSMIASDPASAILNLPVRMSTTMPAVAANALSVALGDWREAYLIVDRLGITVQRDPYTVKPFIEFYSRKRVGGDIANFEALKIGKISA